MLFDFILKRDPPVSPENFLLVGGRRIPLVVLRSSRARRYLLALRPDGSARLTIPRRGSAREGRQFAECNSEWLAGQIEKLSRCRPAPAQWLPGTEIMFRGETVKIEAAMNGGRNAVRFASEIITVPHACDDLRPWIVRHLWHQMAEGVGFEPTLGLPLSLISSQVPSTTQPPFQRRAAWVRFCLVFSRAARM
jgi:hypothetical protein